jgi:hypothetical protein
MARTIVVSNRDALKSAVRQCCRAASCDGSEPGPDQLDAFIAALERFLGDRNGHVRLPMPEFDGDGGSAGSAGDV